MTSIDLRGAFACALACALAPVFAPAFLAATAAAQTTPTTPYQNVTTEGLTLSLAVADNVYLCTQTIYESNLVYRPLQQWNAMWLRPDAGQWPFPAFKRMLTVRLGGQGVPSPELANRTSFAANQGPDLTQVVTDKWVSFPAHVPSGSRPEPFLVKVPFDQPFSTSFVVHLLMEIETDALAGPAQWLWPLDAEQWQGRPWTIIAGTFGAGCPSAQGWQAVYEGTPPALTTTLGFVRQPGAPFTHPVVAWLGTSNTQWGPLALPWPLALIGAPGCAVYTEPAATWVGQTGGGSRESFTMRVPVPRNYWLLGRTLFAQTMIFDPLAGNAAGLRVSPGGSFYFSSPPDPYHAITLQRRGSPGDQPTAVMPDQAIVFGVQ